MSLCCLDHNPDSTAAGYMILTVVVALESPYYPHLYKNCLSRNRSIPPSFKLNQYFQ